MTTSIIYDTDYFIDKFTNIPDELWTTGRYHAIHDLNIRCALGWCRSFKDEKDPLGVPDIDSEILCNMFWNYLHMSPSNVNDGVYNLFYLPVGDSPKERILNALNKIKDLRASEEEALDV